MPGGVKQEYFPVSDLEHRRFRVNRDTALAFEGIVVKVGVAVVDASGRAQDPALVQNRLRERGFARVHVGQYAEDETFHGKPP